ncbi:MAG: hypothetical protein ACXVHJ_34600 [Solirubrobacteraceae bacterium]
MSWLPAPPLVVALVLGIAVPAQAARENDYSTNLKATGQVLAQVNTLTPIATQSGWLAWSERDVAHGFRLVLRAPDGALRRPAIRRRSVPFDVDLGLDSADRVVATYSRCTKEPQPQLGYPTPAGYDTGRGCAPYLLDVMSGRERRVTQADAPGASEVWPSPWRDRLAFERVYEDDPGEPVIYVGRSQGAAHSVRQAGGTNTICPPRVRRCKSSSRLSANGLELHGDRLAFTWVHETGGEGPGTQIRLDTVGGSGRLVAAQRGGGITQVELGWPAFSGRWLTWSRECFGDPQGCPGRYGLERAPLTGGAIERAPGPRFVISHDADATATFVLDQGAGCITASNETPCELSRLAPVFTTLP